MQLDRCATRSASRFAPSTSAWCRRPAPRSSGSATARCSAHPPRRRGPTRSGSTRCRPAAPRTCAPKPIKVPAKALAKKAGAHAAAGGLRRTRRPAARHPEARASGQVERRPHKAIRGVFVDRPQPTSRAATAAQAAAGPRARRSRSRRVRAMRGTSLVRLRIGFLIIAMVVSVFAVRLFELQGVDAQAYVAKARAEGVVTVTLPATRGAITDRNGVPLADSVDGLMIVADPTLTTSTPARSPRSSPGASTSTTSTCSSGCRSPTRHFQYIARRVPATEARAVVRQIDAQGYKGIDTRRDPVRSYPGDDVAANLVGFMNAEGQAAEGAELMFNPSSPARTAGDLRGRRRQPDPARRQQHGARAQRARPEADHRPRRAVVHPAGAARRRPGRRRRVRRRPS